MKSNLVLGILALVALLTLTASATADEASEEMAAVLDSMNVALAQAGADYRAAMAEYITGDGEEQGITVIASDVGNKQLAFDFVPGDPRRAGWSGAATPDNDDITYAVDTTGDAVPVFGGLTGAETDAAIDRAMATWDLVTCSHMPIVRNPDFGLDVGLVAFILSGGTVGSPFIFADVQHAGWRDLNFAGGVLGVTFTFGFTSGGVFTDVNNDGKLDAAFREIYYDPSFNWADDGVTNIDVESVALHEAGHGLSQAHFGKVFLDNNGVLKFAPQAVMNAVYAAPQRDLKGTDEAGHCSIWSQWPQN